MRIQALLSGARADTLPAALRRHAPTLLQPTQLGPFTKESVSACSTMIPSTMIALPLEKKGGMAEASEPKSKKSVAEEESA